MVANNIKNFLKMKNKDQLSIEKTIIKYGKINPLYKWRLVDALISGCKKKKFFSYIRSFLGLNIKNILKLFVSGKSFFSVRIKRFLIIWARCRGSKKILVGSYVLGDYNKTFLGGSRFEEKKIFLDGLRFGWVLEVSLGWARFCVG